MPKKRKKSSKAARDGSLAKRKAIISKSRGHKPVAVLESFHAKMVKNVDKLANLIERRRASGE
jgi:hypothetical protein